jgi:hypothetical protein
MATEIAEDREQVHNLIERLSPNQLVVVRSLLQVMVDPVSTAIANAPVDDEPESEGEREAVAEAKEWFAKNPQGIAFEEVLADFGLTIRNLRDHKEQA